MKLFKKILPSLIGSILSLSVTSTFAEVTSDYGLRTINIVNDFQDIATPQEYEYIFTYAMITKGPTGYNNINNFVTLYKVFDNAHKDEQLTKEGESLYQEIRKLYNIIRSNSSSKLTDSGKNIIVNLGHSFALKRKKFLISKQDYERSIKIDFEYNGDASALDTGEKFVLGMTRTLSTDTEIAYEQNNNETLLSFYTSNEYKRYLNSYPDLVKTLGRIQVLRQTQNYIKNILPRVFKKKYLDELNHFGVVVDRQTLTKIEAKDFVSYLFDFYKFIPSLDQNKAKQLNSIFDEIIRPSERLYFAGIEDAQNFYKYGPGFTTQNIAKLSGKKIFLDLAERIKEFKDKEANYDYPIKLAFADARTMMAFQTFLRGEKVGESLVPTNDLYEPTTGNFDTSKIAPLNSILVLDMYRNREGNILIKPSLNGKYIELRDGCKGAEAMKGYYSFQQLMLCVEKDVGM